jgi:hypothetical protein
MSKTPLTDHYTKRLRNFCGDEFVPIEFARTLEIQRDRLAEALREIASEDYRGPRPWSANIADKALAAVKGGSDDRD